MKYSRQWANEIEEKLNILYTARRKRRKQILQVSAVATCFLVVLTCVTWLPEIFLPPVSTPPENKENTKVLSPTPSPTVKDDSVIDNFIPENTDAPDVTATANKNTSDVSSSSSTTDAAPKKDIKVDSSKKTPKTKAEDDTPTPTKPPKKTASARPPINPLAGSTPPPTQAPSSPQNNGFTTGNPPLATSTPSAPQSTSAPAYTAAPGAPATTDAPYFPPPGDVGSVAPPEDSAPPEPETPSLEVPNTLLDILLETPHKAKLKWEESE